MTQFDKERFTEEEVSEMKKVIDSVGNHLPQNVAGLVWNKYSKIINDTPKQPCMCGKSAQYWKKAVETIRSFIKDWC